MKEKISDCIFIWIFILQPFVEGGTCWNTISKSGKCKSMLMMNVTKEQCCFMYKQPNVGWTPHSLPASGLMFYWEYLSEGAPMCRRCHNSCDDIKCPINKKCRLKRGRPKCICKPKCNNTQRKKGPVCGTDMMKYKHFCHLLRYNCKYNTQIKVDYYGNCKDSCGNVNCPSGRFCVEDQNGLPHCINCSINCALSTSDPVCGDNLRTYQSACHLKAEICKTGFPVHIAYPGQCKANASCANINCPHFMDCLVNPVTRQPSCVNCRQHCSPLSVVPVCGTDGNSYENFCKLRRKSCEIKVLIQTKHSGHCNRKRHSCRNCKKQLKRILRRRNKRRRHRKWRKSQYSKFKLKKYGGFNIFPIQRTKMMSDKVGSYKEFG